VLADFTPALAGEVMERLRTYVSTRTEKTLRAIPRPRRYGARATITWKSPRPRLAEQPLEGALHVVA